MQAFLPQLAGIQDGAAADEAPAVEVRTVDALPVDADPAARHHDHHVGPQQDRRHLPTVTTALPVVLLMIQRAMRRSPPGSPVGSLRDRAIDTPRIRTVPGIAAVFPPWREDGASESLDRRERHGGH
jgi:hypothetical protein